MVVEAIMSRKKVIEAKVLLVAGWALTVSLAVMGLRAGASLWDNGYAMAGISCFILGPFSSYRSHRYFQAWILESPNPSRFM